MKHIKSGKRRGLFEVLANTRLAQAAIMVLRPGQSTGEPDNEHPRSEQWLFVVEGSGRALAAKRPVAIRKNSLVVIEKGEAHQITNTGRRLLVTISFYVPPAYTLKGDLKNNSR
jgi:mannose-6-phosphate isomerase-like protein (cupin superfamily)